jgi:hypothetical protein
VFDAPPGVMTVGAAADGAALSAPKRDIEETMIAPINRTTVKPTITEAHSRRRLSDADGAAEPG